MIGDGFSYLKFIFPYIFVLGTSVSLACDAAVVEFPKHPSCKTLKEQEKERLGVEKAEAKSRMTELHKKKTVAVENYYKAKRDYEFAQNEETKSDLLKKEKEWAEIENEMHDIAYQKFLEQKNLEQNTKLNNLNKEQEKDRQNFEKQRNKTLTMNITPKVEKATDEMRTILSRIIERDQKMKALKGENFLFPSEKESKLNWLYKFEKTFKMYKEACEKYKDKTEEIKVVVIKKSLQNLKK